MFADCGIGIVLLIEGVGELVVSKLTWRKGMNWCACRSSPSKGVVPVSNLSRGFPFFDEEY